VPRVVCERDCETFILVSVFSDAFTHRYGIGLAHPTRLSDVTRGGLRRMSTMQRVAPRAHTRYCYEAHERPETAGGGAPTKCSPGSDASNPRECRMAVQEVASAPSPVEKRYSGIGRLNPVASRYVNATLVPSSSLSLTCRSTRLAET